MSEARIVNPLVEQFMKGTVPRELRLLGAQGALPLKPSDIVELMFILTSDPDESVRGAAVQSLTSYPAEELVPIVKDKLTPPGVLAWVLVGRKEREVLEPVLQNQGLSDQAIEDHVGNLPSELAELVVINQVRLLRRHSLLVALERNPSLSNDQRRRLRELRETFHIGEEPAAPEPAAPAPAAPPPTPPAAPAMPADPNLAVLDLASLDDGSPDVDGDPALALSEALTRYLTDEERAESEKVNAVQKIYRMNTAEKIISALKGTREERTVLIRDPNRLVATAVLGSPKLTDAEVESFAAMKNISDEVLRKIGTHKEWTKKYTVISSLVKNPRTPMAVTMTLVSRLLPRDMKALSTDRNVSEVVRKTAQKFVKTQHDKK
jgi:hypothetical protein